MRGSTASAGERRKQPCLFIAATVVTNKRTGSVGVYTRIFPLGTVCKEKRPRAQCRAVPGRAGICPCLRDVKKTLTNHTACIYGTVSGDPIVILVESLYEGSIAGPLRSCAGVATVAERLACSPPTKANRVQFPAGSPNYCKWESCRSMPLVGGFSLGSPVPPSFHSGAASLNLIGSQDLAVKSRPNIFSYSIAVLKSTLVMGLVQRAKRRFSAQLFAIQPHRCKVALVQRENTSCNSAARRRQTLSTVCRDVFTNKSFLTDLRTILLEANQARISVESLPDLRMWESCGTLPLVGRFSRGSPVSPALAFRRCTILIGSQNVDVCCTAVARGSSAVRRDATPTPAPDRLDCIFTSAVTARRPLRLATCTRHFPAGSPYKFPLLQPRFLGLPADAAADMAYSSYCGTM
ncbi:hypothetical protein PR048_023622 [Dryococelus australis]|uniref:Uncharacterized protein n=1 Tax=Dryococelus australis TaxID=614101 RepID=A0ABQ9GUP8_9NEOP|nr:hypothetical protein PR048_023622 [Dryococelus australis]